MSLYHSGEFEIGQELLDTRIVAALIRDDNDEAERTIRLFGTFSDTSGSRGRQSVLARALLIRMLSQVTGTDAASWSFSRDNEARPFVQFNFSPTPFVISISHSGPYVAVAMTCAQAIGVDIEIHKDWKDIADIAAVAFGPTEQNLVRQEGISAFYRIWTLREAHGKATGAGIKDVADGNDRFIDTTFTENLQQRAFSSTCSSFWYYGYKCPIPGLSCALAVRYAIAPKSTPHWEWTNFGIL